MKKERKPLQATTFRSILIGFVVISIVVASIGFYFGLSWLKSYAQEVNGVVKQAGQSGLSLGSLGGLQNDLAGRQEIIKKVNEMFAPTSNYQSQAIKDINAYAEASNLKQYISDVSLSSGSAEGNVPASNSSLKVTFSQAVPYDGLLKFVTYIQNSTPKMQIGGLAISRVTENNGNASLVTIQSIDVEVATR